MCSMNWWASEGINQEIQACLPGHLREETMNIQWPFGRADYAHSHYASIMADVQITH